MKGKIQNNLKKGKYQKKISDIGYLGKDGAIDYLIYEKIIFSHRNNYYSSGEIPEKLHAHDYYELTIIISDEELEYILDGQSIRIRKGMAILTKPMKIHMFRLGKPMCYDRFVLYFKDISDIFPEQSFSDFTQMGNDTFAAFNLTDHTMSFLSETEAALSDNLPHFCAKAYLNIGNLFLSLSDDKNVSAYPPHEPSFISEIKDYIDKNYLNIRSVSEVSDAFFYSREYVSRSFKQYYNTTIYEYILNRKMIYCCAMLKNGKKVEVAAHEAGFNNMPSFVKLFKKYKGCTPSEYKLKNK